jgi:hypothetical protein
MKQWKFFVVCSLGLLLSAESYAQKDKAIELPVESLFDWSDPMALDAAKLSAEIAPIEKKLGRRIREEPVDSRITSGCSIDVVGDHTYDLTAFNGQYHLAGAWFHFAPEISHSISLFLNLSEYGPSLENDIGVALSKLTGDQNPKPYVRRSVNSRTRAIVEEHLTRWLNPKYRVETFANTSFLYIYIKPRRPGDGEIPVVTQPPPAVPEVKLVANLDALLNFGTLWQWAPGDLEKNYVLKIDDQKQQKPPQFEWVSTTHDRARFSRHMFSNTETNLTMFGGSVKLEEAILEFVNGKAGRATISFYNRGDSGDITTAEFDRLFKLIGQNLSQVMKVSPKRQIMSSNAALPVVGWLWTSPTGIALLEYNEYNTPGKVTKPEFLRLKLAAPNQADWSMGKMATGVQRMELVKRVTKKPDGDVFISGVPMVDQGQKGYCVAASCQRLFEYMRIPCDQHEMAKLVNIDAESGADIVTMQKSLAKIDGAFNVIFKPLINPEQYYTNGRKRRVSEKAFLSLVKEYVDKGVPLLWGLMLGEKPEDPPLPGDGQVSGGHMRMVIGYNLAKNQILFTDSWGAGHELKRMAMLDAYDVTMGLYSIAPRGF